MFRLAVVVMACIVATQAASKMPKWVTACTRDENFDACALRNGNAAMSSLVKGDRKYRLPVLDPMVISALDIDRAENNLGLDILMRDVKLIGLKNAKLEKAHMDFDRRALSYTAFIPRLQILSTYTVAGRILILPITGTGPGNITLTGLRVMYSTNFDLPVKAGNEHMTFRDDKLNFVTDHAIIKLDNLFNGDKLLGNQMNLFMNENWRDLVKEIGPAIGGALGQIMTQILSLLADQIPYKDVVIVKKT